MTQSAENSHLALSWLALHSSVATLAWALSAAFSAVFLLRVGLTPAEIFLSFSAILILRFILRPAVLIVAPVAGLRCTFIVGAFLCALSYPTMALVQGIGLWLALFVALSSAGQVFYCTCYHVFFTALGDSARRGTQVGAFQALGTIAAVLGPAAAGLLLTSRGPWLTFVTAFAIALVAILPLLRIAEPRIERESPQGAYAAARRVVRLYFCDGWIQMGLTSAWSVVLFQALHQHYDSFGGTLSLAALAGALGGMLLGRSIDKGHARSAVWINAAVLGFIVVLRATTFGGAATAVIVAVATTMIGGFYLPSWMTAAYNEARLAPCIFRFQFAAEGGWDAGGAAAGLITAIMCYIGWPVHVAVLLALPMVVVQAVLLHRSYADQATEAADVLIVAAAQMPRNPCADAPTAVNCDL